MPPDEPAMPIPPTPRKRTQFASFLTEAASDLSGFETIAAAGAATKARSTEPAAQPIELQHVAHALEVEPLSAGETDQQGLKVEMPVDRQRRHTVDLSVQRTDGRAGSTTEMSARSSNADIVKVSVKVDAITFLELKRALHLRETLQEFCLNAIKRELGGRSGKA